MNNCLVFASVLKEKRSIVTDHSLLYEIMPICELLIVTKKNLAKIMFSQKRERERESENSTSVTTGLQLSSIRKEYFMVLMANSIR